jgi:hypothetical protein
VTANSPALVENRGWEFTASAQIITTKNFKWSARFNTAFNRNKLVAYPNFEKSPYVGVYVIGQPLNISNLLHYTGVDPQTGLYTFEDKTKDGVISVTPGVNDDRSVNRLNPKYLGGFGMDFSYRNLKLTVFFNIKKQIGMNAIKQGDYPGTAFNQSPIILSNRWQNPGDEASIARFTTQPLDNSYSNFRNNSDGGYTDASYVRLSNFSISYNLREAWVKKAGMQGCSLFFNTNNIFTITKFKGVDPETQNFGGLPTIKAFNGGISFNF